MIVVSYFYIFVGSRKNMIFFFSFFSFLSKGFIVFHFWLYLMFRIFPSLLHFSVPAFWRRNLGKEQNVRIYLQLEIADAKE